MPKGLTKFQVSWLDKEIDGVTLKEWCEATDSVYHAKCTLCSEKFDISGSGFAQVRSHHKGKKHFLKFCARFKNKSNIFVAFEKNSDGGADNFLSHQNKVLKAETMWALRIASGNSSFKSCTEDIELFKKMFTDSEIANAMQLKEKKVAYVLSHGIAKYFRNTLMKDVSESSTRLTLGFDESTNVQTKRQLDMYVRYWSAEFDTVSCRYLSSVFLGHATADIIVKELLDTLSTFDIPLSKVICLSMDNPNVNKSVFKKFSEEAGHTLLPIGTCNLHVVNNAFKTFLTSLDLNFDEFANDVYFFLKNSAVRREDYKYMEGITEESSRFLLKHVSSRWLSAGPVALRLVEQWSNMHEYFLKFLPSQKLLEKQLSTSSRYKRIRECMKVPITQCFLALIAFTHKHFELFSLCFQSAEPKIHLLFGEMNKLVRKVMLLFIKDDVVAAKEGKELQNVDAEDSNNWKKLNEVEIGMTARGILTKVSSNEKKNFLLNVRSALVKTVNYLKANLPFTNQIFKDLEIFHPLTTIPDDSKSNGLPAVTRIARYLNFDDSFIDDVREEWKSFIYDISARDKLSESCGKRIDEYWRELFLLKDNFNRLKYVKLSSLIKTVLILPHGNSDLERGFSLNKAMVDVNHSEKTIESLRIVKDTICSYGSVSDVPITLSLLLAVKDSHKSYQEYTQRLKQEEEKLSKEKKQKEMEILEKEETRKRKNELDLQITENNRKIIELKKNKDIALGLIKEGTGRLTTAKMNSVEMTVAQNLICEGTNQLQKLESELGIYETEKDKILNKRLKIN